MVDWFTRSTYSGGGESSGERGLDSPAKQTPIPCSGSFTKVCTVFSPAGVRAPASVDWLLRRRELRFLARGASQRCAQASPRAGRGWGWLCWPVYGGRGVERPRARCARANGDELTPVRYGGCAEGCSRSLGGIYKLGRGAGRARARASVLWRGRGCVCVVCVRARGNGR